MCCRITGTFGLGIRNVLHRYDGAGGSYFRRSPALDYR